MRRGSTSWLTEAQTDLAFAADHRHRLVEPRRDPAEPATTGRQARIGSWRRWSGGGSRLHRRTVRDDTAVPQARTEQQAAVGNLPPAPIRALLDADAPKGAGDASTASVAAAAREASKGAFRPGPAP
jgi:hypothetical protein